MFEAFSITIAGAALVVAIATAWLTLFRGGTLRMTQPTVVFFGPDISEGSDPHNKVFLRTLLYSTSKRGQVIESMHVSLERGETKQNFSVWVYGDESLHRGSGLYVPDSGISYNHHFLLPPDAAQYDFQEGTYTLRTFAALVGKQKPILLSLLQLSVSTDQAKSLSNRQAGLFFDWGPDSKRYYSHLDTRGRARPDQGVLLIREKPTPKKRGHT